MNGPAERLILVFLPSPPVSEGAFAVPRVIRSSPSGVNLRTVWSSRSEQKTNPSGETRTLWAFVKTPSPQDARNSPSRSKTIIGCSPLLKT